MSKSDGANRAPEQEPNGTFDVLFTFESEATGRSYMAYTDHSVDENGVERVFAARYAEDGQTVEPIDSQQEWEMIQDILDEIQTNLYPDGKGD